MKWMKTLLAVMLLSAALTADVYVKGQFAISLSSVGTTGAGTSFAMPLIDDGQPAYHTFTVVTNSSPTSISVNLEGSLDGTNYFPLATIANGDANWAAITGTSSFGEMVHVAFKPVKFLRCNITAYTPNGSTASCGFVSTSR